MSVIQLAINLSEQGLMPDSIVRRGIVRLLAQRLRGLPQDCESQSDWSERFVRALADGPIAVAPEAANEQHYEVPAAFFELVLGPYRKYSCAHWAEGCATLADAEAGALRLTCEHAEMTDGLRVLELGCGWGSLSLWMAARYPHARITAVSNSQSQRAYILRQAEVRGLTNIDVLTADMNRFEPASTFDRVVSVEMFEHMRNWPELFRRVNTWLAPQGRFLMHVFCHREVPYLFESRDSSDWMSRHFFSGGMMPSDGLAARFQDHLRLQRQWRWNGMHYQRTAEAWLENMDARRDAVCEVLAKAYGEREVDLWWGRWRMFFMACAELFGYDRGQQWWVSHYQFRRGADSGERPARART
jgi:cyclopropane-fatty-acyl-phospholipid synthase